MFIELNSFDGCLSNLGHFCFRNGWFIVIQGIQLAIEGLHGLHVVAAEAPSPAAEEAAATALDGESETRAAAWPRGGGAGGRAGRCDLGAEWKGTRWRGRAPSAAARPRHGR